MTAPRLQPADKNCDSQITYGLHTYITCTRTIPFTTSCKNKLCIDTISTGVVKLATTSKALRQGEANRISHMRDLISRNTSAGIHTYKEERRRRTARFVTTARLLWS